MQINLLCSLRNLPEHLFTEKKNEPWGGVDIGALLLLKKNIIPVMAVGDFDSISQEEKEYISEYIELDAHKSEKDDTDLALGVIQSIKAGYTEINIYGATGGRLDHFLGALQILEKPEYKAQNITIKLIDDKNELQYLGKGKHYVKKDLKYRYISLIPVMYPTVLSLSHFKYNLNKEVLRLGSTLTISNELEGDVGEVEVCWGGIILSRSSD
ncbi:thiamine diphosphokinase [Staphylococcus sp. SQ8-PEA]|uniref:Thiamine diphosphokinase n=1 Tax=Staphylococcus marylandisciuri TaxID=2981529 RepID=A0ABT2QP57_9STAP|nr:thiamine diphosphokinase [Staphylococcus marylandisciuri]MCU5745754.1 thiamine diphosphokinase [Staphylococcus marylandisciuri]